MAGTRAGGLKAAQKNLERDPDFYAKIGSEGGKNGHTGGFAIQLPCDCGVIRRPHLVVNCAGVKGGRKSRRRNKLLLRNTSTGEVTEYEKIV